jgi:hypothetical protein
MEVKKMNKEYEKDGVLCSFPYHFVLHHEGDEVIGEEVSHVYYDLKFKEEEKKQIEEELSRIHVSEGAGFYLEGTEINYRVHKKGNPQESDMDNEVNIRRSFIENYLEAEEELDAMVKKYHGSSRKTEFN